MGRKSSINGLPPEVKAWLEKSLADQNFSGYQLLEDELEKLGYSISKSSIHRFGQKMERRMAAIKAATEAARMITEGAADDQDARSEAVIALVQTEIFEAIIELQNSQDTEMDPIDRMNAMSKVAKNIATLTRASISQKQFKASVQAKAMEAAEKVAKLVAGGGMSEATTDEIRRMILGVAA